MKVEGRVFKYCDNVDTDVIIPARYLNISDMEELKLHTMEDIDVNFVREVKLGDVIVAGKNFGCGSSREHAPLVIKLVGVSCVIASTFARIFYRNAINIGLPILECSELINEVDKNDVLSIDFDSGVIFNITKNKSYKSEPFPPFMQNIIKEGGLINKLKKEVIKSEV